MKSFMLAGALLVLGASAASAQYAPWQQGAYPYARRHHHVCQEKARRLFQYERRAASDGRISRSEREVIRDLERDLNRTCGGYRHRG
jgi:hypothetical protein